ncbi:hypothetical protein Nstercoris_01719 [Nitrosomonas stercoris]|uniref:DUF192 domain-containing protein n=1 Tax=Nitrosomonas stercoris TaxID=1444684 RepID=A0A4Y1YR94_9PROT|nr:hypothetical protein Nstercoris_01719 [Nitrosomonas stercoris]
MLRACFAVLLIISGLNTAGAENQQLPIMKLSILDHVITVELADTASARMIGLMHRRKLPENDGMLFIFPAPGIHCMWMKDTVIPLSVAFLDEMGKIINLAEMVPETLIPHCSVSAARYALEMNSGWFTARKIKVGDRTIEAINSGSIW